MIFPIKIPKEILPGNEIPKLRIDFSCTVLFRGVPGGMEVSVRQIFLKAVFTLMFFFPLSWVRSSCWPSFVLGNRCGKCVFYSSGVWISFPSINLMWKISQQEHLILRTVHTTHSQSIFSILYQHHFNWDLSVRPYTYTVNEENGRVFFKLNPVEPFPKLLVLRIS